MFRKTNTYHDRKQMPYRQTRFFRYITIFIITLLAMGFSILFLNNKDSQNIILDTAIVETAEAEPVPHPLDNIILPQGVESAVGTLTDGTVMASEPTNPIPMASITKIVTALVVLEKAPINLGESGDMITLSSKDEDYYWKYATLEGTLTPVTAGYTMSQYEILQTMLLPSSNNMSDTLVDYYFDSHEEFLHKANEYLSKNGLSDTKVVDATGFSPESVSTPSDLIKLGQLALKNPVVAEIVAQPEANVSVAGHIRNYNVLIGEPNVTGIKPGFTEDAGSCLLYSANFVSASGDKQTVIMVVMGAQDRSTYAASTLSLLDQARSIYEIIP